MPRYKLKGDPNIPKPNRKKRRHSGWKTPNLIIRMKWKKIIEECLEPQQIYSDWNDHRDGLRDWFGDNKKIKKIPMSYLRGWVEGPYHKLYFNKKQKKLLKIRKARKGETT